MRPTGVRVTDSTMRNTILDPRATASSTERYTDKKRAKAQWDLLRQIAEDHPPGDAFLTFFRLIDRYCDRDIYLETGELVAYPGQERLAKELGLGLRTIKCHMRWLVGNGHCEIERRGRRNRYIFRMRAADVAAAEQVPFLAPIPAYEQVPIVAPDPSIALLIHPKLPK
jgi:hypothetical protein